MTTIDQKEYAFEGLLEKLQLLQICQNMLQTTLGFRRDFYEEQVRKNRNKITKIIEAWPEYQ